MAEMLRKKKSRCFLECLGHAYACYHQISNVYGLLSKCVQEKVFHAMFSKSYLVRYTWSLFGVFEDVGAKVV